MKAVLNLALSFLLLTLVVLAVPTSAFAQDAGVAVSQSNYKAPQNSDNFFIDIFHSVQCFDAGTDVYTNSSVPCLTYKQNGQSGTASTNGPALALYNHVPDGGVLGGISNVMVAMYTSPPISSTEYMASVGEQIGVVSPAYAASVGGAGSGVIHPILVIWQYIRNIAYLAFIIIFLAVGFMVMFRQKISQQTVVSVQMAIPGLVVGLILVTFSYFLSALIIDSAFIGVHLAADVFVNINSSGGSNLLSNDQIKNLGTNGSIWSLFGSFIFNGNHFGLLVGPVKDAFQQIFPTGILKPSNGFGLLVGGAVGGLVGLIALLVVMIALTIAMFKTLWELIQAYITILITTILSPFIILMASFPGRGNSLGGWWRTILGNALIFPAVFGAFLFAGFFLSTASAAGPTSSLFVDQVQAQATSPAPSPSTSLGTDASYQDALPLFNGIPVDLLKTILGYGILLAIPGIPKQVKEALKVKDNPLGATAQAGFVAGAGYLHPVGSFTGQQAVNRSFRWAQNVNSGVGPGGPTNLRERIAGRLEPGLERVFGRKRDTTRRNDWFNT